MSPEATSTAAGWMQASAWLQFVSPLVWMVSLEDGQASIVVTLHDGNADLVLHYMACIYQLSLHSYYGMYVYSPTRSAIAMCQLC